jgi:hypothetical protein
MRSARRSRPAEANKAVVSLTTGLEDTEKVTVLCSSRWEPRSLGVPRGCS